MRNVKNAEMGYRRRLETTEPKAVKPLKFQGFEDLDGQPGRRRSAQDRAAARSRQLDRLGSPGVAGFLETLAGLLGVGAVAVLLTYGNLLMEALFNLLGI